MQVANFLERPRSHRHPALEWWAELNAELAARGESEAGIGHAIFYLNSGYEPADAAALLAEDRRWSRAND